MSNKFDWDRHNKARGQWPDKDYDWTDAHTVPTEHKGHTGKIFACGMAFALVALPGTTLYLANQTIIESNAAEIGQFVAELPSHLIGVYYTK